MVVGKILLAAAAIIAFVVLWRLLDIFLGFSFGILLWVIKAILFVVLLYVVYRIFAGARRLPAPR